MKGTIKVSSRLWWIFVGLAGLFLVPLLFFRGELLDWTPEGAISWLSGYGRYAWLVALGLLISDLVLPMPSTAVMAALGYLYGPVIGGMIGAFGTLLSGCLAYSICRSLGQGAAIKLVGESDLRKGETLFRRYGAWLIVFFALVAAVSGSRRQHGGVGQNALDNLYRGDALRFTAGGHGFLRP